MKISEEVSQKIKNMGIVCAMLIVTIHVEWPHDMSLFAWLMHNYVKYGVAQIAVPFFFSVSGFLLAKHMDGQGWYGMEIRKRVYSLAMPYCVWTLISVIFAVPHLFIHSFVSHQPFNFDALFVGNRWIAVLGFHPFRGPSYLGALWYVRCLFVFVVLAPIFKRIVSRMGLIWLALMYVLAFIHASWRLPYPFQEFFLYGFSLSGMFYFSLGIYIGLPKSKVCHKYCLEVCSLVGLILLLTKILLGVLNVSLHFNLVALSLPFVMSLGWYLIPSAEWPHWLTQCSFPVFLMHMLLIPYFALFVGGGGAVCVGVITASIVIATILKKCFPRAHSFLFAGRG